jgi:hypothetical protein
MIRNSDRIEAFHRNLTDSGGHIQEINWANWNVSESECYSKRGTGENFREAFLFRKEWSNRKSYRQCFSSLFSSMPLGKSKKATKSWYQNGYSIFGISQWRKFLWVIHKYRYKNSKNKTKKSTKAQLYPNKVASLQVNVERTKYIFKSLKQNTGQRHYKYSEQSSEMLKSSDILRRVINKIGIRKEIKSLLISGIQNYLLIYYLKLWRLKYSNFKFTFA